MMSLFDDLGLDCNDLESAEGLLSDADASSLQLLAAGLKALPRGLFTKAFLAKD